MAVPLQKAEALFDFNPTAGVELKLKKGDLVHVRRRSVGEGWWEGELNGFRGLFPSSYVKLLPEQSPSHESPKSAGSEGPVMPLTPGLSKKAFMEALLAPTNMDHGLNYNEDRANEIFMENHRNVAVTVGPSWSCQPPTLTIAVKHAKLDSRASVGSKQLQSYSVETKELGSCVTRKYKQFLWLYDKLAEGFPCISLPPLPVKQSSTPKDFDGLKAWRIGLEKFLKRVANHPVLSSTKVFHLFLTAKDDKDWKIGRHNSHIKVPKSAKKLFSAPVYTAVQYPAYNVPLTQLASMDKFAKFTRLLEMNVQSLQFSCLHVSGAMGDMLQSCNYLGKDLQKFSRGIQLNPGPRRKMLHHHQSNAAAPALVNGFPASIHASVAAPRLASEEDDASDDDEVGGGTEWNWREDESYQKMCKDLYDIAGGIRGVAKLGQEHQEAVDKDVVDTLRDYSSIIHTLPVLVKLHEEAMEMFKASKDKDSKKEAEEVRQHCETLNNILLAEFDNFSVNMIQDFENMMERFLRQQVKFHNQMAGEWDALHRLYSKRLSSSSSTAGQGRRSKGPFTLDRISRQSADGMAGARPRSGSLKNSFTSSLGSTSSYHDTPLARDVRSHSSPAPPPPTPPAKPGKQYFQQEEEVPVYINVHRKSDSVVDLEDPDDFVDPEFFKHQNEENEAEPDGVEVAEDVVMQAWSDHGSKTVECDGDQCQLVDRSNPSAQPSLYEIKLQGEQNFISDEKPQQVNWVGASAENEGVATSHAHPSSSAAAPQGIYPPQYNDCLSSSTQFQDESGDYQLNACNIDIPENTGSEEDEAETEASLRQQHFYKNIPLLIPPSDQQSESQREIRGEEENVGQLGNSDDHSSQQPPSSNPIYSNMVVLQQSATSSSVTSSSPPKQAAGKAVKKPMPIQRKKTKSEDILEEEVDLASVEISPDLGLDLTAAPLNKGNVMGSPSAGKKKPPPPVKPAKLSLYIDGGGKRPMIPAAKKGGGKTGRTEGNVSGREVRPHSSSMSDEGEVFLSSGDHSTSSSKPRSYTQASADLRYRKQPLVPSSVTTPTVPATAATVTKTTASKLSDASVDLSEVGHREADLTEEAQSGLKVCGILVSPSEESSAPEEDNFRILENRPPSPVVPPPPSSTLTNYPTNSDPESQNETKTATKARVPFKPSRFGSVKKNNTSSKSGGASSSENSPSGRDELMKKLSLRRMKIDEQIGVKTGMGSGSSLDGSSVRSSETGSPMIPSDLHSLSEDSEARSSLISSSSTNSEVVVAYHAKGGGKNVVPGYSSSTNGLARDNCRFGEDGSNGGVVPLREGKASEEDGSLAKFGIIEDVAGGSYII